jgi:tetratricopeptide (TPR) repeat protein
VARLSRKKATEEQVSLGAPPWLKALAWPIGLVLLVFAIFANTLDGEFTNWDDNTLVKGNGQIRSLAPGNIVKIFTPQAGKTFQPVRVLSWAVDYALWEFNPRGYHAVNILLHALATVLLLFLLRNALPPLLPDADSASPRRIANTAALLFALHPINVEAVAWITSRKYGLLAVFGLFGFYAFLRALDSARRPAWLTLSTVSLVLAMLSSPFGIVWPVLIVIHSACSKRLNANWQLHIAPMAALAVVLPILLWALTSEKQLTEAAFVEVGIGGRAVTMLRVFFDYGRNLLLPLWLNCKYPDHLVEGFDPKILVTLVALVATFWWAWRAARAGKWLAAFCLAWFWIALSPVFNVIAIAATMADRYLYVAAIGVFIAVAAAIERLPRPAQIGSTTVLAVLLGLLSFQRNRVWQDSETLWRDSLAKDADNLTAHFSLGNALEQQGKREEALVAYKGALAIDPDSPGIRTGVGNLELTLGRPKTALEYLRPAVAENPKFPPARRTLGVALIAAGFVDEGIRELRTCVEQEPHAFHWQSLADALVNAKRHPEAIEAYQAMLALSPGHPDALNNLGAVQFATGDFEGARASFEAIIAVRPDALQARSNLANSLWKLGRVADAVEHYRYVVTRNSRDLNAAINLARGLDKTGDYNAALGLARQIVQHNANSADALTTLTDLLARQEATWAEARPHFERLASLKPNSITVRMNVGRHLMRLKDMAAAGAQFEAILRLDPQQTQARKLLATCRAAN